MVKKAIALWEEIMRRSHQQTVVGFILLLGLSASSSADLFDKLKKAAEDKVLEKAEEVVESDQDSEDQVGAGEDNSSAKQSGTNETLAGAQPSRQVSNREGPYCMEGVCIGDDVSVFSGSGFRVGHWSGLANSNQRGGDWFDGNGNRLEMPRTYSGTAGDNQSLAFFHSVNVTCVYSTIQAKRSNVTATLEPRPSNSAGWQGFQVVRIYKSYELHPDQLPEWERLVKDKYPHASNSNRAHDGPSVIYSSNRHGTFLTIRSGDFPEVWSEEDTEKNKNRNTSTQTIGKTNALKRHPMCPKPEVTL